MTTQEYETKGEQITGFKIKAVKLLELHEYQLLKVTANMIADHGNMLRHEIQTRSGLPSAPEGYAKLDLTKIERAYRFGWRLEMMKLSHLVLDRMFEIIETVNESKRLDFDEMIADVTDSVLQNHFIYYHQWHDAVHFGLKDSFIMEQVYDVIEESSGLSLGDWDTHPLMTIGGKVQVEDSYTWRQGQKYLAFAIAEEQLRQELIWSNDSSGESVVTAWDLLCEAWELHQRI